MTGLVIEKNEKFMHDNSSNIAIALRYFAIILISSIYIFIWMNLNNGVNPYLFDRDTIARLGLFKLGVLRTDTHFLINMAPFISDHIGIDALNTYRIVTAISMLVLVLGVSKFTYIETKDNILAFLLAILILLNAGFTTALTELNDKLPMYTLYIFFIIYLLKGCWIRSAIFLSLSILFASSESLVYIPIMMCYALLMLDFEKIVKNSQRLSTQIKEIISIQSAKKNIVIPLKFIIVTIILIIPIALIMFSYNIDLYYYINYYAFDTSAYRQTPYWWYFISNRTPLEQLHLVYIGVRATFGHMQSYPYTFWLLLGLILYVSIKSFSLNRKMLCAIPTFLFLIVHSLFFDSDNYERWLFLSLFMIYFIAIGYAEKNEPEKKSIRYIVFLIILISALFIHSSYSSTGGHANPFYTYVTKIPELLDNKSIVLEAGPASINDFLVLYFCGSRATFIRSDTALDEIYQKNNTINASDSEVRGTYRKNTIYTSRSTYDSLKKKFPGIAFEGDTIYVNRFDKNYDIVKLKIPEDSNNSRVYQSLNWHSKPTFRINGMNTS